ncbi:MAG: glycosyltransferase [Luteitalea sp.]|nr:glycosyltransferase [Luteitalea sp.]
MRIGIDARELCGRPTGVGRYLSGLLRQWLQCDEARQHQFVLYAHEIPVLPTDSSARTLFPGRFTTQIVPGSGGTWWEQRRLPASIRHDRLDVFFAPGYTAPLWLPVPLVVAIHDVSFAAHPEWFTAREGLRRRFLSRRAAGAAAAVITISEFSRRELVERLGADSLRIHVIPPGVDAFGTEGASPRAVRPGAHVLYVGSIFNRRHIPDLVRAFSAVIRTHPEARLDIVGDNRTWPRQSIGDVIDREGQTGRVRWHQYVTDAELVSLYSRSRVFAFLSEYEGLGLTPLEALAAGIPSVLLDTPVARESCGAAALYAGKGDIHGIAVALEQLLFDEQVRRRLLAAAPDVLARYNWTQAARRTLGVLETSV